MQLVVTYLLEEGREGEKGGRGRREGGRKKANTQQNWEGRKELGIIKCLLCAGSTCDRAGT